MTRPSPRRPGAAPLRSGALAPLTALLLLGGCADAPPVPADTVACRTAVGVAPDVPRTLTWKVFSGDDGRAALDAFCAGVGPALLVAPEERPEPGDDALAIVAWNTERGFGDVPRLVEDLRAGRLTGGAPVRHFVLLLQEATRSGPLVPDAGALPAGVRYGGLDETGGPDVETLAHALGLHAAYVPSMRNGRAANMREDEGNAVLSTLPLARVRALELPHGIQRRVAVAADVPWPSRETPLTVVSVHLDNASLDAPLGSLGGVRARQARALARLLPEEGPLVVGGDLNTWLLGRREAAARTLRRALPRPAELPEGATARRLGVGRRLDYLLLRAPGAWRFESRRIADRYGADHHPLVGVLRARP